MTQASDRVEAEAARWLIQVEAAGSPEKWAALDAWLAANPRHRAVFLRLSAGWRRADQLRSMKAFDGSVDLNLLSPGSIRARKAAARFRKWQSAWSFGLRAAAAAVVLGLAYQLLAPFANERLGREVYVTQIGDQQHLRLADGSTVDLNTDSELTVQFTAQRRRITLVRGEAAFRVTHNPTRPFDVHAGKSLVRVLGTAFSIRVRDDARVDVRVTEGRVAIRPPAAVLNPGDSAVVSDGRATITREQLSVLTSKLMWTEGRLFFNGETLAQAVSEFNRYNRQALVIMDPKVAGLRISGTFQANDPEGFVTTVKALPAARASGTAPIRLYGKER